MTRSDRAIRATTTAAVATVAGIAAIVSYRHMRGVALTHGEDGLTAAVLPLSVDGLIVAASMSLLVDSRAGRRPGAFPWFLLLLGSAASLWANVIHAAPTTAARLIAAWPPLALALTYHLLMSQIRKGRNGSESAHRDSAGSLFGSEPAQGGSRGSHEPAHSTKGGSLPFTEPAHEPVSRLSGSLTKLSEPSQTTRPVDNGVAGRVLDTREPAHRDHGGSDGSYEPVHEPVVRPSEPRSESGEPLSTEERRRLVAQLHSEGKSARAIADVLGVPRATVNRDVGRLNGAAK